MLQGKLYLIGFRSRSRGSFIGVVNFHLHGLLQLACRNQTFAFVVSDETCKWGNAWMSLQKLEDPFFDPFTGFWSYLDCIVIDRVLR